MKSDRTMFQKLNQVSSAIPGDYDGDGKTDLAVYCPLDNAWFLVKYSTDGSTHNQPWVHNTSGDIAVLGDYDGDGKTDLATWSSSTGNFNILYSSNGSTSVQSWGLTGDIPIPGINK